MKILFVTSEHPSNFCSGQSTFVREYVRELKKYADVKCIYFHFKRTPPPLADGIVDFVITPSFVFDAFSADARILESSASLRAKADPIIRSFCPDIIHCSDSQSFLPFRFDKNVFYSSRLKYANISRPGIIDDIFFQDIKAERCALENSALLAVYSDFAARKVEKLTGGLSSPLVLPLGVRFENFCPLPQEKENKKERMSFLTKKNGFSFIKSQEEKNKISVCFFGRFENLQKGVNDFIFAVNALGSVFKQKNNLEYNLYGKGQLNPALDLSLFDNIKFLKDQEVFQAYRQADILVIPSRYEDFGFTALEAMAAGCLVLLPKGLGMDMYAEFGYNCLELPLTQRGITDSLEDAVINFEGYKLIRENALRSASRWSWKRSVFAHLYFYRQLIKGRISQMNSAYRAEERAILEAYRKSSDVEKLHCAEIEKKVLENAVFSFVWNQLKSNNQISREEALKKAGDLIPTFLENTGKRILILTGVYQPERNYISNNVEVFSVLNEGQWGITVRPECLPFDDEEFDCILVCGAWETVVEPCGALVEMQRVSKKEVHIFYNTGLPHSWQFYKMENEKEWSSLTGKNWTVSFCDNFSEKEKNLTETSGPDRKDFFYKTVSFLHRPRPSIEKINIG